MRQDENNVRPAGPSLDRYADPRFIPTYVPKRVQAILDRGPARVVLAGFGKNGSGNVFKALLPHAAANKIEVLVIDSDPAAFNGKTAPPGFSFRLAPNNAIAAKIPIVAAEKPVADTALTARGLIDDILRAGMDTLAFYVSHYLLFSAVSVVRRWVSAPPLLDDSPFEIKQMVMVLRERQGIGPAQAMHSQKEGAKEPAHHGLALAALLLGLDGWVLGPCYTARHPAAPIPKDKPTYAALCLYRPGTIVTLHLLIAKYQEEDESRLYLVDRKGRLLVWDRRLQRVLFQEGAWTAEASGDAAENPYVPLFSGLFDGAVLPPVLTPHVCHRELCILEDALRVATPLKDPRNRWIPPGFGIVQRVRAAYEEARETWEPAEPDHLPPHRAEPGWPAKASPEGNPTSVRQVGKEWGRKS